MKSVVLSTTLAALSCTAVLEAARIDMDAPHRALGREGNVRIDAQLSLPTVSPGAPIGVTYQVQNLSKSPVALADGVSDASYDRETRTITFAIGSEVPPDGKLPHMVLIDPGEKKVLRTSATPQLGVAGGSRARGGAPRYLQIKVAILRDIQPFDALIRGQETAPRELPDHLFEKWFECNDTILLNVLPVDWEPARHGVNAADQRSRGDF